MKNSRVMAALGIVNLLAVVVIIVILFTRDTNLVYVDSAKLLNGYQGMIDARAVYQKKASDWKANIDTLSNEVHRQIMKFEKENGKMSVKEKQLSQELIRTKQKQLYDYQQALNSQAQQEDNKITADVVNQVNLYLKKFGESNGYKIILAATEYGNLAYADETLDITEEVLIGLNKEYKGM